LIALILSAALIWAAVKITSHQNNSTAQHELNYNISPDTVTENMQPVTVRDTIVIVQKEEKKKIQNNIQPSIPEINIPANNKIEQLQKPPANQQAEAKPAKNTVENPVADSVLKQPDSASAPKGHAEATSKDLHQNTPEAPKEIFINDKIIFKVVFEHMPDMNYKRSEQPVKFIVSNPVKYQDVTIINEGAIAKGKVTLGRKDAGLEINSVQCVNGQQIQLKAVESHIWVKEINLVKEYPVMIKKGVRISF
jgi:hypothetical protein